MINSFDINNRVTSLSCYPKELANCPPIVYLCIVLWEPRERWQIAPTRPETNARQVWKGWAHTCYDYTLLAEGFAVFVLFSFLWKGWRLHNYRCCCLKLRMFSKPLKGHTSSTQEPSSPLYFSKQLRETHLSSMRFTPSIMRGRGTASR